MYRRVTEASYLNRRIPRQPVRKPLFAWLCGFPTALRGSASIELTTGLSAQRLAYMQPVEWNLQHTRKRAARSPNEVRERKLGIAFAQRKFYHKRGIDHEDETCCSIALCLGSCRLRLRAAAGHRSRPRRPRRHPIRSFRICAHDARDPARRYRFAGHAAGRQQRFVRRPVMQRVSALSGSATVGMTPGVDLMGRSRPRGPLPADPRFIR